MRAVAKCNRSNSQQKAMSYKSFKGKGLALQGNTTLGIYSSKRSINN